jgi:hypothetical protein
MLIQFIEDTMPFFSIMSFHSVSRMQNFYEMKHGHSNGGGGGSSEASLYKNFTLHS